MPLLLFNFLLKLNKIIMKKQEILLKYNLSRGAYCALVTLGKIVVHSRCDSEIVDENFVKSFNYEKYKQDYHNSKEYKKKISERNTKVNKARWSNASEESRAIHKEKCRQGTLKSQKEHPEQLKCMKDSLKKYWSNKENRQAHSAKMKEVYKNEEKRNNISKGCKKYWSNEENRLASSYRMLNYWSQHPEILAKMKETNKQTQLSLWDEDKKIRQSDITKSILHKIYSTKKANNSFNISEPENNVYQLLLSKFSQSNIERQYFNKELYPFNCDFYIKSLDLYIECHFNWTHGGRPFDSTNEDCTKQLNDWKEKAKSSKFYQNAIYTWTDLDVRKLQTFMKNCLSYKIFYNYKDFEQWLNNLT